jgi:gliding motility-associated transport system ATP-binding protein
LTTTGVQVVGVSRRFGRVQAISDVTFDIVAGEVLGLLGPNGAGKTTTMRVMTGYLQPSAGRVTVRGVDLAENPIAARQSIGYVPESSAVPGEMSVIGFLGYCARLRRVPRHDRKAAVGKALGQAGLGRVADQRIATLSRGYRQRVALAQALVHDPPVLILDEPTLGLDPRQVTETRDLIAKLGRSRTVLLSSHLLSEVANLCRRVVVLDKGRVLATSEVAELTAATGTVRLELRLSGDPHEAVRVVSALTGVTEAEVRGGLVVVKGEGADLGQRVSRTIIEAGIGLLELRATTGTLEEAYLKLVRE